MGVEDLRRLLGGDWIDGPELVETILHKEVPSWNVFLYVVVEIFEMKDKISSK